MIILWILVIPITGTLYVGFRFLDCIQEDSSDLKHLILCFTNDLYMLIMVPIVYYIHVIFMTLLYFSQKEQYRELDFERSLAPL